MLIDAAHPEEVRVAILNGNRLEEFDFETAVKRQIKGNIYLAKVTRVEPSLQAAFVEYGGNRHGFLAFNEIHPDYYRIPVGDRAAFESIYEPPRGGDTGSPDDEDDGLPVRADRPDRAASESAETTPDAAAESTPAEGTAEAPAPRGDAPSSDEDAAPATADHPASQAAQAADDIIYDTLRPDTDEREVAMVTARGGERDHPAAAHAADTGEERHHFRSGHEASAPRDGGPDTAELASFTPPSDDESASMPELDIAGRAGAETEAEAPLPGDGEPPREPETLETLGGDEEGEEAEAPRPRFRSHRHYKIQEVIKRRQIMLVQVTKEERGNKGAALTTYLSLAGRYCVLMPNTPRGGGVSRKITSMQDRRRLKDLMSDLSVPDGMGVIVRTAGSERSKAEIKRDFEYLQRLWDEIRDLTLKSTAPALVYEEGNLIKRSIRDLYARDIEEVVADGEDGYKAAKAFMKMLMPSHAKRVKLYRDATVPLFHRYQVEAQIDAVHSPIVQLRSGGYIVINPTEALVAIDVNSGRATRERNIEETALRTNLEAAEEVARQLRLRDLAGLIVVDFIDMEEARNNFQVERRIKDSMRHDRARIQIGRISAFGLLELSRQRLRPSILEASTEPCPYCAGTGHVRSTESTALHILRAIEEEGMRRRSAELGLALPTGIALYLLNQKREALIQSEHRYGFKVTITRDDTLIPPAFRLDRLRALSPEEIAALPPPPPPLPVEEDEDFATDEDEAANAAEEESDTVANDAPPPRPGAPPVFDVADEDEEERAPNKEAPARDDEHRGHGRRRRRRGEERGRRTPAPRRDSGAAPAPQIEPEAPVPEAIIGDETVLAAEGVEGSAAARTVPGEDAGGLTKRRRRGRRGGRRRRRDHPGEGDAAEGVSALDAGETEGDETAELGATEAVPEPVHTQHENSHETPHETRETREISHETAHETHETRDQTPHETAPVIEREPPTRHAREPQPESEAESEPASEADPETASEPERPSGPPRRGWWHRR
jgi:ribonuclease E